MELRKYQNDIVAKLYKSTFIVFLMSMMATTVGNFIDGVIIGKNLGADAMAAFGFSIPLQKLIMLIQSVLTLGMQILVSQKLGKGKLDEAIGIFSLAISMTVGLLSCVMLISLIFPEQVADMLGADKSLGAVRQETIDYVQASSLGLPAIAAVTILSPIMQLDGDKKRAVTAVTILSVSNVIGDLIAIFYFGGGMWEIGMATSVAYFLALTVLLLHFRNPNATFKFSFKSINISELGKMILNGAPIALGRGASMLQSGFLNYIVLDAGGAAGVAALAIWNNVFQFVESIPKSVSSTTQMIAGILIGEEDKKSIFRLIRVSLRYAALVSISILIILTLTAPVIAGVFTSVNDAQVFDIVNESLHFLAFCMIVMPVTSILQYFYQACGRFKLVSIMSVANNILFIVPLALILTLYFEMTGVWATFLLNNICFLIAVFVGIWCYCKKITFNLEDILLLPKDFGSPNNPQMNMTVTFKDDDLNVSEVVEVFFGKARCQPKKDYVRVNLR